MSEEDKIEEAAEGVGQSTDDRPLADILKEDIDQVDSAFRKSEIYYFSDRRQAYEFQARCVVAALTALGCYDIEIAFMGFIGMDRIFDFPGRTPADPGIRIEKRAYHHLNEDGKTADPENAWRSGIYVYQMKANMVDHNALAFFVSNVKVGQLTTTGVLVGANQPYAVRTNAKVDDDRKTIYSIPKNVKPQNLQ